MMMCIYRPVQLCTNWSCAVVLQKTILELCKRGTIEDNIGVVDHFQLKTFMLKTHSALEYFEYIKYGNTSEHDKNIAT